ncbi:hypothetical protein STCU_02450 [Strigomonas culicis]|uniref:Uncharacterized protein n=1 Tax=Strigomonas culicis TaxID=28005 RepID=S9W1B9_9TRYP|nr:hypothetical protein STCU_02450 [Strigomonas culicis]|eukprot:EPY33176.1 hypothetical protein STCU_02450 [Strigomonas culicis]
MDNEKPLRPFYLVNTIVRIMVATLSIDSSKWAETIESSGEECLTSPISAKNVEHVLSTAVTRKAQKNLCASVLPFAASILKNRYGISIIISLVNYGTPKTVELVTEKLLAQDEELWTFKKKPSEDELTAFLSTLLERIVYREDCTGAAYTKIVDSLKSVPKSDLFRSPFTLAAAGRLVSRDSEFATKVSNDKDAKKALCEASTSLSSKDTAQKCIDTILQKGTDDEGLLSVKSKFVYEAFEPLLAVKSSTKPREDVLLALASLTSSGYALKLAHCLCKWDDLHTLAQKDSFAKVLAVLLERSVGEKAGLTIVSQVITTAVDIDTRLSSRKTAQLHLLAAISKSKEYTDVVAKKLGGSQEMKLKAARARYINATVPKALSTQASIQEKIKALLRVS